jgi:hypothetical protein
MTLIIYKFKKIRNLFKSKKPKSNVRSFFIPSTKITDSHIYQSHQTLN